MVSGLCNGMRVSECGKFASRTVWWFLGSARVVMVWLGWNFNIVIMGRVLRGCSGVHRSAAYGLMKGVSHLDVADGVSFQECNDVVLS